ncbi:MAG: thiamine pyrophosphate-dependent enzyme [Nanoarchaeota archaeon]
MTDKTNLRTNAEVTWCPGCHNFRVLFAVQKIIEEEIRKGKKKEDFAIVCGIGCHAKIFDYLDLPGINTLHGRVTPTCLGMKLAKPDLTVLGFSGDGDAYAEGMEHLIHMSRYNSNFKYLVSNNQVFALTLGQPTPTTELEYIDKTNPSGNKLTPLNPVKLMLSVGASFVARIGSDIEGIKEVLTEAMRHKGFAYIEILQPCIIFHNSTNYQKRFYNIQKEGHDKTNLANALIKAEEFDYNSKDSRIPVGIFYQKEKITFEELILEKRKNFKHLNNI